MSFRANLSAFGLAVAAILTVETVYAQGGNFQPLKGEIHQEEVIASPDGNVKAVHDRWGKFYRSAAGSTVKTFLNQVDGSPVKEELLDAIGGRAYEIDLVKHTFSMSVAQATGQNFAPGGRLAPPGSVFTPVFPPGSVTQTVNGVDCVLMPAKGPNIKNGSSCYSLQFNMVVRTELTTAASTRTGKWIQEYKNLAVDTEQHDASFFQLPPGLTQTP